MVLNRQNCQLAIDAQYTVNLQSVVTALHDFLADMRRENPSTTTVNNHPVVKLYVAKLVNLSYGESVDFNQYREAFDTCTSIIDKADKSDICTCFDTDKGPFETFCSMHPNSTLS